MARETWPAMFMMICATSLRRVHLRPLFAGNCGNLLLGVAAVALVVGWPSHWSCARVSLRAVVVPPTSPAHQNRKLAAGRWRNKTLSCSCPTQKRKNFVSRGADHFAALRGPFPPGSSRVRWTGFRAASTAAGDHAPRKPAPAAIVRG